MLRIETTQQLQAWRKGIMDRVGFVPTMGALHQGHLSLIEASQVDNDVTVVSIFVNPTQFDQAADLEKYPNTLEQDLQHLEQLGIDAVFLPTFDVMYPDVYAYKIFENDLSKHYCGAHRPGHFDGVLTVVMKLLNLVDAERAYFGEKDYQQLTLIKGMVNAFFMNVKIVACPIVREADGLAMSSRNLRLTPIQRKVAPMLHQALIDTDSNIEEKRAWLTSKGFEVDYLEVMNDRLLAAVSLGEIRLIDNVPYSTGAES
ncbi:MAG: pantoate--beta-alanine ligase [Xanthomonadales bacterium]|nr:pantoate--beta-alanine ligase [Xanthomonadales bacterium]